MKTEFEKEGFYISTYKDKLQLNVIHGYLKRSYWAKDIEFELVKKSVENSFCFGVFQNDIQIGFARLITDYARFAYLADVFILEEFRGKGLSKWLMQEIIDSPELKTVKGWMLKTSDAHGLYKKAGFEITKNPEKIMELSRK